MNYLFIILLIILFISIVISTKENFTMLGTIPVRIDPSNDIYQQMLDTSPDITSEEVEKDLRYFNNASNILFGLQRIPT